MRSNLAATDTDSGAYLEKSYHSILFYRYRNDSITRSNDSSPRVWRSHSQPCCCREYVAFRRTVNIRRLGRDTDRERRYSSHHCRLYSIRQDQKPPRKCHPSRRSLSNTDLE